MKHDRGATVVAVAIEYVRQHFYELTLADGATEDERIAEKRKAFKKATRNAQERHLIGAFERDGVQWVALQD